MSAKLYLTLCCPAPIVAPARPCCAQATTSRVERSLVLMGSASSVNRGPDKETQDTRAGTRPTVPDGTSNSSLVILVKPKLMANVDSNSGSEVLESQDDVAHEPLKSLIATLKAELASCKPNWLPSTITLGTIPLRPAATTTRTPKLRYHL